MNRLAFILTTGILVCLMCPPALSIGKHDGIRTGPSGFYKSLVTETPNYQTCTHRYNSLNLTISNMGFMGAMNESYYDCETGAAAPGCEYPAGTQHDYLYATGLWIGAIVGEDTLVSTGWDGWQYIYETWPCGDPECAIEKRSTRPADPAYSDSAISDLDYIAVYTDTLTASNWVDADWDGTRHKPLGIEIRQSSYSWSVDYAEDFILIDYQITNIGIRKLENVYLGLQVDGDVSHVIRARGAWTDDICGYRETFPSQFGSGFLDTIDFAWIADNDGDPSDDGLFDYQSVLGLTGVRVMRTPKKLTSVAFNWWTSNPSAAFDWGPMYEATRRNFGTGGLGTPEGDRAKYYLMSNGEQDYDQIFAAEDYTDFGWLPPGGGTPQEIARGGDARYLLSTGPFDINIGETLPLTIAYVGGEDFHRSPSDFENTMLNGYNPDQFYQRLDFSDVAENCVWAYWVYDNPGVDTDNDGNRGSFWEKIDTMPNGSIVIDTFYYAGDGVPDFKAATPPPAPSLRFTTENNKVTIRFNGIKTENFVDPFTRLKDFEGYNVYFGRQPRMDQLALTESRDIFNFRRFRWDPSDEEWVSDRTPFELDSLGVLYGEGFDPSIYSCDDDGTGFVYGDDIFCFEAVGWNNSIDGWMDGSPEIASEIRKRFADEILSGEVTADIDSSITSNWTWEVDHMTGDSTAYHKYYEYEYEMDNLLSSVPWYFSVTAFDFGDLSSAFGSLENSPLSNVVEIWPVNDAQTVLDKGIEVSVYPNPYMGDGRYVAAGYEDPGRTGFTDHQRRIHFVNLPPECTITIYTVSGDKVRSIDHPGAFTDTDSHAKWDMRSTNNELVASGIYIFVVESDWGNQLGKIVVIM